MPLPIAGMLAAFLSFVLAAPYVGTLTRPQLDFTDPASHYTLGTTWALIQHSSFGLLLVGFFVPVLLLGRRPFLHVVLATVVWSLVGGLLSVGFDSMLDAIAISIDRSSSKDGGGLMRPGGFIVHHFYGLFQTIALAFPIAFASGATKHRFKRALIATAVGAVFSEIATTVAGVVMVPFAVSSIMNSASKNPGDLSGLLAASIPGWQASAIAVGLALGLTMGLVEYMTRTGIIRRMYGRKEFKEWELAGTHLRIGSGEVEIRLDSCQGVEPVHAVLSMQGNQHVLDSRFAPTLVNGIPVGVQPLMHGDRLQMGDVELIYLAKDASGGVPKPRHYTPVQVVQVAPVASVVPVAPVSQVDGAMTSPTASGLVLVDSAGTRFALNGGEQTVGRDLGNSIVLANQSTVSRRHATISSTPQGVELRDEGSSNGTFQNGLRITGPVMLRLGDRIGFGSAKFVVESQ